MDAGAARGPTLLRLEGFPAPHAFTTRQGGVSEGPFASLNLSLAVGDDGTAVAENRRRAARAFDAEPARIASVRQVHGARVVEAHAADPSVEADALISDDPRRTLAIAVADCVPVLLVDTGRGAVAAVHAGWRGVASGVIGAAIAAMRGRYGTDPADLRAAIGPCISAERYQVGAEVVAAFREAGLTGDHARPDPDAEGRYRLSVASAATEALVRAGVRDEAIVNGGWCTASDVGRFYSHRRDGPRTGRQWALVRAPSETEGATA